MSESRVDFCLSLSLTLYLFLSLSLTPQSLLSLSLPILTPFNFPHALFNFLSPVKVFSNLHSPLELLSLRVFVFLSVSPSFHFLNLYFFISHSIIVFKFFSLSSSFLPFKLKLVPFPIVLLTLFASHSVNISHHYFLFPSLSFADLTRTRTHTKVLTKH